MSRSLAEILPDSSGKAGIRVWLKSSGYARRLLLGEAGDPWLSAAGYLAFFSQSQGLLRPDVAVVEVGDLFQSWAGRHPDLVAEMGSKRRLSYPLRKLLEADEARHLLAEVVEAVTGSLRGQTPLVLSVPTPRTWLRQANLLAGRAEVDIDPDAIENAAMYMADLFRSVSSMPVGGLLLDDGPGDAAAVGDIELCRPILNVARHYRWSLVWRTQGGAEAIGAMASAVDAVISASPVGALERPVGLDVGEALWNGGDLPSLTPGRFYFAEIPVGQLPESVLENLTRMRV